MWTFCAYDQIQISTDKTEFALGKFSYSYYINPWVVLL